MKEAMGCLLSSSTKGLSHEMERVEVVPGEGGSPLTMATIMVS